MKSLLSVAAASLIAAACSGEKAGDAGEMASDAAPQEMAAETSAPSLSGIDLCALVPAEKIAAALGGTVLKPPGRGDYGQTQSCDYAIDPAGADNNEFVQIYLYPPSAYSDEDSSLETATGLGQTASIAAAPGYGDHSYALINETEQQAEIMVLVDGRAALEFKAETLEHAKAVATLGMAALDAVL